MKKTIFFLLCISFFWNSSCKKDPYKDKTVIEGYMLEYGSENPLSNVTVFLKRIEGELFGPSFWIVVDSLHSDESGYVYYEYNHHHTTIDACTFVTPDQYYSVDLNSINTARVNDITKYFDPFAWLEIQLENIDDQDGFDNISIAGPWGGALDDIFPGPNVNETIYRKIRGNRMISLFWRVVENNNPPIIYRDTLDVLGFDTTHLEILY